MPSVVRDPLAWAQVAQSPTIKPCSPAWLAAIAVAMGVERVAVAALGSSEGASIPGASCWQRFCVLRPTGSYYGEKLSAVSHNTDYGIENRYV
jgi:hypothetical protein